MSQNPTFPGESPLVNGNNVPPNTAAWEDEFFAHRSSFTGSFARYHPKHLTILCLTTMVKVLAELKNLRRGHDTQGRLKRVCIDASAETYANYMAPQRVKKIAADVADGLKEAKKITDARQRKEKEDYWNKIYTSHVLRPETATYLTPEWDEFVPFPTTWKLRFDGFGRSEYKTLKPTPTPDDFAPFYETPGGASRVGGSFAASSCVCALAGKDCRCVDWAVEEKKKEEKEEKQRNLKLAAAKGKFGYGVEPGRGGFGH